MDETRELGARKIRRSVSGENQTERGVSEGEVDETDGAGGSRSCARALARYLDGARPSLQDRRWSAGPGLRRFALEADPASCAFPSRIGKTVEDTVARSRKLSCLTAMAAFLACAALAVAQGAGPTLHFTKHGNADVNAQLNLVFKTGPKGTTTTGGDGNATIPGNILSANKPHTHMNVYQCPDGTLYAVEDGAEGRIPCPEKKRRKLGGFYLDDSGTIEINEDVGTPVTKLSQNAL